MNKIVNRLSLTTNKFMSETHLKHPGFVYSFGGSFTKNIKRNRRSKEAGDSGYTYQNKLDKSCFQHDKADRDFKDWPRRTTSDKVLRDKLFNNDGNLKHNGH